MMKKITLLMIAFVFSISFVNAQSYVLSWGGITYGDTVVLNADPDTSELVFHGVLTNNTDDSVTIKVQRRFIHLLDGAVHYFCWGQCYIPNQDSIFVSPSYIGLNAGEWTTEWDFAGHYEPVGAVGTSLVEYKFFNIDNEDEQLTVVVKYVTTPNGIIDQVMEDGYISEIYPNPATHFINLDYELTSKVNNANISVMNLLGSVVKNVEIDKNSTNLRLDISNLTKGVYFYSVVINNKVYKTKKLIVR